MGVNELIAMNDMMHACFTYKRYVDHAVFASCSCQALTVSVLQSQELQRASDLLHQALNVLEPRIQELLARSWAVRHQTH